MEILRNHPASRYPGVFNPWRDVDPDHDQEAKAPLIRARQLRHYLHARLDKARFCLIGEALGYQGGHFTGMAMTSERILLGHKTDRGICPQHVLPGLKPQRTSRPEIKPKGFSENTATVVWGQIVTRPQGTERFVIWNAFAWHPFDVKKGCLSNRRPSTREMNEGLPVLKAFCRLFPQARYLAVGEIAATYLKKLGMPTTTLRHPSMGGVNKFRRQFKRAVKVK